LGSPNADTIVAVATAPGRGAVGIVRLSGADARVIAETLTARTLVPRRADLAYFRDSDGEPLDQGLVLYFAAPASYTGEDSAEFHCHGSPVVLSMVLDRCVELGARTARPGEFTERAYLNGKLDLPQAEAVADVIDASSRQAARSAVRSLEGAFSKELVALRQALINLRILVEASLDFPEDDAGVISTNDLNERISHLRLELDGIIRRAGQGKLLREGARVVLLGEANVGKSSLLNALAGDELAIVTDVPGTTRDLVRAVVLVNGIPFTIIDTAGLRPTADVVERMGIERAVAAAETADLVLQVVDGPMAPNAVDPEFVVPVTLPRRRIVVRNKIDLRGEPASTVKLEGIPVLSVSARTGEGLDLLRTALAESVGADSEALEGVYLSRSRHVEALRAASANLRQAGSLGRDGLELVAEELRYAEVRLGDILGRRTSDDLLGDIFRSFCIGK
jgi:tRNA modification GTPase